MWTYRNFDVFPADRNSSGIRWYCRTGEGITLKSDTKSEMRVLINEHIRDNAAKTIKEQRSKTDWKIYRNGRLYDSVDPDSRAVIQIAASLAGDMPGDSWEVRDHNGAIQYQRSPATVKRVALNPKQAARGETRFRETMTPENRPVRCDVYTPFIIGLELAGYKIVQGSCGCNILSQCDNCKSSSRTLIEDHNKSQLWACANCNTLEPK